ncbi:transposase [Sulfitobacter sp. S46]|jgi:IS5 family transposase|nr:transposase [Sulfitobacter sp. Ks38]MDF3430665.1 transposase [Sulfitobacter sp. S46]MDF3445437.1 transposase [Sulfitobacter sp. KE31]MDF3549462.1 transposase [Sulfitobacter sp. KE28]|tara:strand:- start:5 stop:286 length:282 start_codon:yes stop_codon:yes gene_type:complete
MDAVVPRGRLMGLITPHYPKTGSKGGRSPNPLEMMLRIYFLQNRYALNDPMAEDTLYDVTAMRSFAGLEMTTPPVTSFALALGPPTQFLKSYV